MTDVTVFQNKVTIVLQRPLATALKTKRRRKLYAPAWISVEMVW